MNPYDHNPYAAPTATPTKESTDPRSEYSAHLALREMSQLVRAQHNAMVRVTRGAPTRTR